MDNVRNYVKENPETPAVVLFILVIFILTRFFCLEIVVGSSMRPTLHDGQYILSTKTISESEIDRGTIVIAKIEENGKELRVIKRVVAVPGDEVQIISGTLYVNGEKEEARYETMIVAGTAEEPLVLGEDEYFLLGDNRNGSEDSRYFGPVKIENIGGRMLIRLL